MEEVQGRVELKYCERCGSLWLRQSGMREAYCGQCQSQMRELPLAGYQKQGKRRVTEQRDCRDLLHAVDESPAANCGGAF